MADGRAVVEQGLTLARAVPVADRHGAAFELQRRCDTVARLELVALEALRVSVRVDETRRDHEAGGVERGFAEQGCGAHRGNLRPADADVPHAVETRFGIDDPSTRHDEIERGSGLCDVSVDCADRRQNNRGHRQRAEVRAAPDQMRHERCVG
jgi:hypothetical protein